MPVRDASDSSATSAAPSERAIHSGMPSHRTAAAASGACERCQRSLASEHSGEAGRPVCAANRWRPRSRRDGACLVCPAGVVPRDRRAHRLAAMVEQHAGLGHAGDPDRRHGAGRGFRERPRGHRVRGARDGVRIELGAGRHRASTGSARGPRCSSSPSESSTSALQYVVPTSMPSSSCRTATPLRRRSSGGPPCGGGRRRRGSAGAGRRGGRPPPSTASARR